MLLTINYKGSQARDLGYLLHKNPERTQEFDLNFGKAYVFYTEADDSSTTAALLLDINPVELARTRQADGSMLFDYVNDRPYVSSSFMSTAITKVFGTAMSGRSKEKQQLADTPLLLTIKIYMLPVSNKEMLVEIFEPLGYSVKFDEFINDIDFPAWGMSRYVTLTISGKMLLRDVLRHLYVLIPVFDAQKHYYISKDEIEKLLSHGEGWLKNHPKREYIASRYLNKKKVFINKALEALKDDDQVESTGNEENKTHINKTSLNQERLGSVLEEVRNSGAKTVIDMGCGEGKLTGLLIRESQLKKVTAVDVSFNSLEKAMIRLKVDQLSETLRNKLEIFQGSLTYKDERFEGFDCACVIEVIEHLDINRLNAFERILFEFSRPKTVILTTPNVEFNVKYENMQANTLRHGDHRFEWSREQFAGWAISICKKYGYTAEIKNIGEADPVYGSPTQMGVFTLCV